MDTGPQKESDTPQEARRTQRKERQEEKVFQGQAERHGGSDSNIT